MKKLFLGILIVALFSCSNKQEVAETVFEKTFSISIADTVIIDPGEEILYLQNNMGQSYLGHEGKYLYNYNRQDNSLEIIDLDLLKLDNKIRFEREGPHGTGGYIQHVTYHGGNMVLMAEYHQVNFFSTQAERLFQLKIIDQQFVGDSLEKGESLVTGGILDESENHFITTYNRGFGQPLGLAIINLENKTLKKIPISGVEDLAKFRISFSQDGGQSASYPSIYLQNQDGKILISNSAVNEVYTYDLEKDTVIHHTFSSRITPDQQKIKAQPEVHSEEEFQKATRERSKEVTFLRFVHDSQTKRHYRFSQSLARETPEGNIYKPILTIFDEHFNPLFETDELPFEKVFWKYFVKDGKLWLFENMEDEMGFIILEINES